MKRVGEWKEEWEGAESVGGGGGGATLDINTLGHVWTCLIGVSCYWFVTSTDCAPFTLKS